MTDQEARAELVGIPCGQGTPHEPHEWQMSATGYCRCPGAADQEAHDDLEAAIDAAATRILPIIEGIGGGGDDALHIAALILDDPRYQKHPEPVATDEQLLSVFEEHYLVDDSDPFYDRSSLVAGLRAVAAGPWEPVPEEGTTK